jgi:3-hydroxymyristoyl/3-hydroxydecanoyl-(acyl carrier protein) dehydratase
MSDRPVETFCNASGFPPESRCLDGHFPGDPIVPGAMMLAYLAARLAGTGRALERVERMKFQRRLLPGVPFEVRLTPRAAADRAEFRDEKGVFATARVVLRRGNG